MSATPTTDSPRNLTVDATRVLAAIAVVIIHADVFRTPALEHQTGEVNLYGVILNQLARFAVPFFFVVAGYFWGMKVRNGTPVVTAARQSISRIAPVLLAWTLVYLLPYNFGSMIEHGPLGPLKVWYWNLRDLAANPFSLLFESTKQHLWFLIAFLWSVAITASLVYLRTIKTLVVVAAGLYITGILALSYAKTPVGINIGLFTLQGPFFGTLFFVTGYILSGFTPSARWFKVGLAVVLAGYLIHFSEVYWLWNHWQARPIHHYVFGTWLIGLGVAMVALADLPAMRSETMAKLGRLTLGVYLIHPIFLENLQAFKVVLTHPAWDLAMVAAAYALSAVAIGAMAKNNFLRKLVV